MVFPSVNYIKMSRIRANSSPDLIPVGMSNTESQDYSTLEGIYSIQFTFFFSLLPFFFAINVKYFES